MHEALKKGPFGPFCLLAGAVVLPDFIGLPRLVAFHTLAVSKRYLFTRHGISAGDTRTVKMPRFLEHIRAHRIDAAIAIELDSRTADETING